ncbi:hypothetical protein, partial [Burkholderia thailandensis]|uniref:hypothetical protein n=2 Tax=Burkholderia thailandensis TaxID=57975 RepID=UPI001CA4F505
LAQLGRLPISIDCRRRRRRLQRRMPEQPPQTSSNTSLTTDAHDRCRPPRRNALPCMSAVGDVSISTEPHLLARERNADRLRETFPSGLP